MRLWGLGREGVFSFCLGGSGSVWVAAVRHPETTNKATNQPKPLSNHHPHATLQPSDGPIPELAALTAKVLIGRAPLLAQAGLVIDAAGHLATLPLLLDGYTPDLSRLPQLVLSLARDVDWETGDERSAVEGVVRAVAAFHAFAALEGGEEGGDARGQLRGSVGGGAEGKAGSSGREGVEAMDVDSSSDKGRPPAGDQAAGGQQQQQSKASGPHRSLADREWAARHVVFPAMKTLLRAQPVRARDGSCLLLTSMERLYRVFERCG